MTETPPGPGYLPQQVAIDAYGNGGFRFGGMSHRGAILSLPAGMWAWAEGDAGALAAESFEKIFAAAADIEILIVGSGRDIAALPQGLRQRLREHGIVCEAMATGAAVSTYNVLLGENRAVAGAFVAVD